MSEDENTERNEVHIKVDNKATEKLVEMLQNEKMEKEAKELQAEDLAEKIKQANEEFSTDMFLQATSKSMLLQMIKSHISDLVKMTSRNEHPSGNPNNSLSPEQYGTQTNPFKQKLDGYQEVVNELMNLKHSGNVQERRQAEQYLDTLLKKWMVDKRANPTRNEPAVNPNSPEALLDLGLVKKGDFLIPEDPKNGDLGRIFEAWRLERLRKQKGEDK